MTSYPDDDYKGKFYNWYPIVGGGAGGGGAYFNNDPTSATNLEGWPLGTIPGGPHDIQYMWDKLLYPYVAPAVVLSSQPAATYYEKGIVLNPIELIANNRKR